MNEIGNRIKLLRKNKGITQKQFADRILVTQSYLSRVESGKEMPNDKLLKLIALEFEVPTDWLEDGNGTPQISNNESDYFDRGYSNELKNALREELETFSALALSLDNAVVGSQIQAILSEAEAFLKSNQNTQAIQVLLFEEMTKIILELFIQMNGVTPEISPEQMAVKSWHCIQTMTHCLDSIRDTLFNPEACQYRNE